MNNLLTSAVTAVLGILLASCGGSGTTEPPSSTLTQEQQYELLLGEANAARAEAVAAAASSPCSADDQCSTLAFRSPLPPCYETSTIDYSLASPGAAAASAAAAHYAQAASAALAVAPPNAITGSCFRDVDLRPMVCIDNSCQRGFRF